MHRVLDLIVPPRLTRALSWRLAASVVTCLAAWCLSSAAGAQEPARNPKPVRSTTPWGLDLIVEGCQKSPAFRALVERLQSTDLVVYVEPARRLPGLMRGGTEFAGVNGAFRYLRVSIDVHTTRKKLIALVGHELQHAAEIGSAPEVVNVPSLEALYRRIGYESPDGYDTTAAREMGEVVLAELWRWRAAPPASTPSAATAPGAAALGERPRPSRNAEFTRR